MAIKTKEIERLKNMNAKLRQMNDEKRLEVNGYRELTRIQNAYIAILLKKLGATKENPATMTKGEVKDAVAKGEPVMADVSDSGYGFYIDGEAQS